MCHLRFLAASRPQRPINRRHRPTVAIVTPIHGSWESYTSTFVLIKDVPEFFSCISCGRLFIGRISIYGTTVYKPVCVYNAVCARVAICTGWRLPQSGRGVHFHDSQTSETGPTQFDELTITVFDLCETRKVDTRRTGNLSLFLASAGRDRLRGSVALPCQPCAVCCVILRTQRPVMCRTLLERA